MSKTKDLACIGKKRSTLVKLYDYHFHTVTTTTANTATTPCTRTRISTIMTTT